MSRKRFEITCPHCRRSYALRVDPENLSDANARVRCGRCRKRFRLSAAVDASTSKTEQKKSAERATYRKRISRPMMSRKELLGEEQRPSEMVDDMARAFERALQERRKNREDGLTATEADLPLEEERAAADTADVEEKVTPAEEAPAKPRKRRKTPRVFRFTPPPVAREIIFGKPPTAEERATAITQPAIPSDPPPEDLLDIINAPGDSEQLDEAVYGQERKRTRSSRPPRPDGLSSVPPPPPDLPHEHVASRKAWLDFADEPLDTLIPARGESVTALEWLLGEDALGDV